MSFDRSREQKLNEEDARLVDLPCGYMEKTRVQYADVACKQCGKEGEAILITRVYSSQGPILMPAGWFVDIDIERGHESGDEEVDVDTGYCSRDCLISYFQHAEEKRLADAEAAKKWADARTDADDRRKFELLAKKFLGSEGDAIVERLKKEGK